MIKIRTNLINPISPDEVQLLKDYVLGYDNGIIKLIRPYDPERDKDSESALDSVIIPGLIDLHTHLSQYHARASYQPSLLPWLYEHIFPAEARSKDPDYARATSAAFFKALFAAGTTTAVIYTAPFKQACEIALDTALQLGARALIGMTMMDANSPDYLIQKTAQALDDSFDLFERYNAKDSRIGYIFSPRFALSCSADLMKQTADFAHRHDAYIQSHLSENEDEVAQVKEIFGKPTYTQVYEYFGLLGPKTILGHAIHLSAEEMNILARSNTAIAHCPESNFFLKSGEFPFAALLDKTLRIGLASDVAAGNSLSMLQQAKFASYRQSSHSLSPQRLFWHLTLGAAEALGWQDRIGSLQIGKDADLCQIKLKAPYEFDQQLLSALIYLSEEFPISRTIIHGNTVFQS